MQKKKFDSWATGPIGEMVKKSMNTRRQNRATPAN
jgi:hypothetical protein